MNDIIKDTNIETFYIYTWSFSTQSRFFIRMLADCQIEIRFGVESETDVVWMINVTDVHIDTRWRRHVWCICYLLDFESVCVWNCKKELLSYVSYKLL